MGDFKQKKEKRTGFCNQVEGIEDGLVTEMGRFWGLDNYLGMDFAGFFQEEAEPPWQEPRRNEKKYSRESFKTRSFYYTCTRTGRFISTVSIHVGAVKYKICYELFCLRGDW